MTSYPQSRIIDDFNWLLRAIYSTVTADPMLIYWTPDYMNRFGDDNLY